ncbi:MAG: lysine--tRNA ligase [Candidatus Kerfeldbacteria bacterium]|nr:lysine--tRNA ligase [Candidatus Kerfeldbacteria bacterium]
MSRIDEEYLIRIKKLDQLRQAGIDPYPPRTSRRQSIDYIVRSFDQFLGTGKPLTIPGRIKSIRAHGGSTFVTITDDSGSIQGYLKKDTMNAGQYDLFSTTVDIGDFISLTGTPFTTKRGEKTILATDYSMLSKSLLPLPEKWHGLSDVEIRYRKRYLDLISNEGIKDIFRKRALLIKTLRSVVEAEGFMEVDTPVLQSIPGGATARPFITHHNALDADLYLRIAPELYLKRLIVGGFEKVYEIARCFRNEGIDRDHNPEFTQIEMYAAYWDYAQMMKFTETIITSIVQALHGTLTITTHNQEINFTAPYHITKFRDAIKHNAKVDIDTASDDDLRKALTARAVSFDPKSNRAKLMDELFKETVRKNTIDPTFIIEYPIELSPLAKKCSGNERYVERFQLLAGRTELCNAFTELNDPIDQRARFANQEEMRAAGDDEAQRIDEDFIEALSHGMPPTAGIGIGIDRLVALLTDSQNLKEVILFPTLKPVTDHDAD